MSARWGPTVSTIALDGLRLRQAISADFDAVVELQTDPLVRRRLGGARPEEAVRASLGERGIESVTAAAGHYVVADGATDRMLGMVMLDRRPADRPGHVQDCADELELSFVFRRSAWGRGHAFTASRGVLLEAAPESDDQPVLVVAQVANVRARRLAARLRFLEVDTFEEHGAEQVLAVASLHELRALG